MAKGKRHGGRRGFLSKFGKKVGSLAGTAVQLIGVLHGIISGVARAGISKDTPAAVVYDYSGADLNTGAFSTAQLTKSATIIAVTFGVGWAIKQIARRM